MFRSRFWWALLLLGGLSAGCSGDGSDHPLDLPDGASNWPPGDLQDAQTGTDAEAQQSMDSGVTVLPGTDACTPCDGTCVDLMVDPAHCGACNTPCSGNCTAGHCEACQVALYLVADLSGSTNQPLGATDAGAAAGDAGSASDAGANSRLEAMKSALHSFVDEPSSAGLRIGLGHFPIERAADAGSDCAPGTAECTSASNGVGCCPNGGTCFPFLGCFGGTTTSCDVADYAKPDVELGELPMTASSLHAALTAFRAAGQSPEIPALEGALSYARSKADVRGKVSVVLFADGPWNTCGAGDAGAGSALPMAELAARYASGSPAITTYVVGIQGDADAGYFDPVASAGGTDHAYNAASGAEISAALTAIREHAAAACQ